VYFLSKKEGVKLSEKQSQDKSPPSLETFRRWIRITNNKDSDLQRYVGKPEGGKIYIINTESN